MTGTWLSGWATGDIVTAAEFKKGAGSIFDSTLGGSAANIDITSIPATYANLLISLYARGDTVANTTNASIRFNGDAAANYDHQVLDGTAATAVSAEAFAGTGAGVALVAANSAGANLFSSAEIFIPHYAGSANNKQFISICSTKYGTSTGNLFVLIYGGAWRSSAAINRITIQPAAGNFVAGTRVTVHALGA